MIVTKAMEAEDLLMTGAKKLIFKVEAYTPDTFPMKRLAEYMADLAVILGEPARVHFVRLDNGSTWLVHQIDHEAVTKVDERLSLVKNGNGPPDAQSAANHIDKRLREDSTSGVLFEDGGPAILEFPGIKRIPEPMFGPFNQHGTIDGVVIRVGGSADPVWATLRTRDGLEAPCSVTKEIAKGLGKHLFQEELRCSGVGRWLRNESGNWVLVKFTISGFEVLDERPLSEVVIDLRGVEDPGWRKLDDPWAKAANLRGNESELD
jgi:hypothetical protein